MKELNNQFNEELQQQIEGTLPKKHVYNLGYPGEKLLSAGIENLPIAINNPIAVINSTKNDNAKMILTELKDKNKNNFVVIIKIRKGAKGRKNSLDVLSVVSIYPKDKVTDLMNWLKSGNKLIAWLDKEKALNFVSSQSSNVTAGGHKEGLILNIVNNFENINKIIF